ncbi:MAG: hypothetical protein B7X99_17015 [Rhizobiales bacterium 17-65-6]|nr:MAG: hypothetical protein B7Z30_00950 [Rhizobiales bacterium 12-68-15]OYX88964.1 MAG: hypothetical protein B7Y84_07070 [Azorhizobium sp. 32-67-21]OYZ90433.1 MAG: hypothetical protein B7X99_17015 [Rhizobiales bacterium 17-65-6]
MLKTALFASLLTSVAVVGAQAQTVAALTGDNTIVMVDAAAKKADKTWKISGISGKVLGIDVRPADGMLYALIDDGSVVTVDTATGKATVKSKLESMLPAGVMATVDFNPAADRLRVIGSDGTNLRVNVDDGKVIRDGNLTFAGSDAMKEMKPNVVAGAYTNSVKGTKDTVLFDIDASGTLLKQAPPNDGILNTVGKLGISGKAAAFDIVTDASGINSAWLMSGDTLYKVDLTTGAAMAAGKISGVSGTVRDIAILPAKAM